MLRQHVMAEVPDAFRGHRRLDPAIGAILRRLLAKVPEDRFASTADLLSALDECPKAGGLRAPLAPTRPSLESVPGMTTPTAQRVRRSVLAAVKAVEGATRRALADPKALRWQPKRGTLFLAALVVAIVATMFVLLAAGSATHAPTSTAPPPATDSVAVVVAPALRRSPRLRRAWMLRRSGPHLHPPRRRSSPATRVSPRAFPADGPGGHLIPPPSQWSIDRALHAHREARRTGRKRPSLIREAAVRARGRRPSRSRWRPSEPAAKPRRARRGWSSTASGRRAADFAMDVVVYFLFTERPEHEEAAQLRGLHDAAPRLHGPEAQGVRTCGDSPS